MFHLLIFIYKCQRCSIICIMQKNTLCLQTHQKWGDKVLKINPSLPTLVSGQKRQLMTTSRGNTKLHLWLHQPRSPTWGRHGGLATLAGMEMVKAPPFLVHNRFKPRNRHFVFLKWANPGLLFVYFRPFTHRNFNNTNWKKPRWCAWDSNPRCRMVGADETIELWRPPNRPFVTNRFKFWPEKYCPDIAMCNVHK